MVNLTKVNSVLAKDEESSHHMAKDALKKCVFTALLIFCANCAPPAPPVFSWLWPVLRQTKCGQTLIYLTAWHFVFPIMVRPCYCSAETRWHQHLFGFLSKFSTQSLTDVKQFLQRKINRYNQQFMKESFIQWIHRNSVRILIRSLLLSVVMSYYLAIQPTTVHSHCSHSVSFTKESH